MNVERTYSFDGTGTTTATVWQTNASAFTQFPVENETTNLWEFDTMQVDVVKFDTPVNNSDVLMGWLGTTFTVGEHHFPGIIGEVLVYDSNATDEVIAQARNALVEKWTP